MFLVAENIVKANQRMLEVFAWSLSGPCALYMFDLESFLWLWFAMFLSSCVKKKNRSVKRDGLYIFGLAINTGEAWQDV